MPEGAGKSLERRYFAGFSRKGAVQSEATTLVAGRIVEFEENNEFQFI